MNIEELIDLLEPFRGKDFCIVDNDNWIYNLKSVYWDGQSRTVVLEAEYLG